MNIALFTSVLFAIIFLWLILFTKDGDVSGKIHDTTFNNVLKFYKKDTIYIKVIRKITDLIFDLQWRFQEILENLPHLIRLIVAPIVASGFLAIPIFLIQSFLKPIIDGTATWIISTVLTILLWVSISRLIKFWGSELKNFERTEPDKPNTFIYGSGRDIFKESNLMFSRFHGNLRFPRKVYECDSKNIILDLRKSSNKPRGKAIQTLLKSQKNEKGILAMMNIPDNSSNAYLEFELIAAGFEVKGDEKQKYKLDSETLHYQWNCFFRNSGNQDFALVARIIDNDISQYVGRIEDVVKVVKLGNLTQQQVWILASVAGVISGGLAIAEVLKKLFF